MCARSAPAADTANAPATAPWVMNSRPITDSTTGVAPAASGVAIHIAIRADGIGGLVTGWDRMMVLKNKHRSGCGTTRAGKQPGTPCRARRSLRPGRIVHPFTSLCIEPVAGRKLLLALQRGGSWWLPLLCACLFLLPVAAGAAERAGRPLLIQWGQVTPDPRLLRRHVAYWEAYLPFDGIVIPINQDRYAGRYGSTSANALPPEHWPLTATFLGEQRARLADYRHAIADLQATPFRKFRHNFIPMSCYPRMGFALDWFSDEHWDTILHNVGILARIAKQGGCVGLWLDTEQYGRAAIWSVPALRKAFPDRPQDADAYRRAVRRRATQFIRAVNAEFPGCHFGLAYGSCAVHWALAGWEPAELAAYEPQPGVDFSMHRYGLLAPFVDGLIDGADSATRIIDGYELSYYYKTESDFAVAGPVVHDKCRAYSMIPDRYAARIELALGLYPLRKDRFVFTPAETETAVSLAMQATDRYVWIWNEAANFWIRGGPDGQRLPADQPGVNTTDSDPAYLTDRPTPENVMATRYHGVPTAFIEAISRGKAAGLAAREP